MTQISRGRIFGYGAVAILLLAIVVSGWFIVRVNEAFGFVDPPLSFKIAGYQKIVAEIQSGAITVDSSGVCVLPESRKSIVLRGEVYVGRSANGKIRILFPTWYGRGSDVQGYLYADGGLDAAEIYQTNTGSGGLQTHASVGPRLGLTVVKKNTAWYWCTRRLD